MGGICGFVGASDESLLEKMSCSIQHRGRHEKVFIDNGVSLSSRSPDDKEGLAANEDGSIFVAFDGEIYNRKSLQNALETNEHKFHSPCNSELIAHLYEKYGDSCVNALRGPFAFALWDSRRKTLLLARDRKAEKSIFYAFIDGVFCFASEIKALLCWESIERKLNLRGLDYFFSWGHVPAPETLFDGIKKLPPSYLLIHEDNKITLQRYWKLDFSEIDYELDEGEWCRRIYSMLIDSIRVRLTKGPLGILLGGLDSSTMASLIRRLTDEPLKSFTINFEDEEFNEPYAKSVAHLLEIEAYERTLYPKDYIQMIQELVHIFDDLKVDAVITIPTLLSLMMAKEHVKTVFTADGADCAFWSWGWRPSEAWRTRALKVVSKARPKDEKVDTVLRSGARKRHPRSITIPRIRILHALRYLNNSVKARIQTAHLPPDTRFLYDAQYFHEDELEELLGHHILENVYAPFLECMEYSDDDLASKTNRMRLVNKQFEVIGGWGVERLGDICSHFSLDLRTPFEDYKLKEMAAKIPPHLKQPNEQTDKYILRKMALKYSLLPKEVVKQRKWGFGWGLQELVSNWFKGELKDYTEQTIIEGAKRLEPILREKAAKKYLRIGRPEQILSLLMFILWYERFFERDRERFPII